GRVQKTHPAEHKIVGNDQYLKWHEHQNDIQHVYRIAEFQMETADGECHKAAQQQLNDCDRHAVYDAVCVQADVFGVLDQHVVILGKGKLLHINPHRNRASVAHI